jgi:foldase protein PrsA
MFHDWPITRRLKSAGGVRLFDHFSSPHAWRQGCEAMTGSSHSQSKFVWIAAGTGAAMLGAAILFQAWRAQPGTAAEGTARSNTSGKVSLNDGNTGTNAASNAPKSNAGARVSNGSRSIVISMDDVAQECVQRLGKEVLENMINRATIQLACHERNIVVTAAEVDREIVRIAGEFKIPAEQYLQMLKTERDITPEQYRRDVIWPMLALRKLAGEEVHVTQEEIQKAFEREYGPRVKARMILCDNQRRAQTAWSKAKQDPDNFEKYVQEFSIDPASKSLDGSIPPIPRHSGSPNIEQAAFKLKPGEISPIVQLDDTLQRYVILKCEGRTEPIVTELDEQIAAELEEQIKRQKVQEQVAKVFETLKKGTRVDNYLTNTTTGATRSTVGAKSEPSDSPTANPSDRTSGTIRPASAQGTTNRVTPASATPSNAGDLPPTRPATRSTTAPQR